MTGDELDRLRRQIGEGNAMPPAWRDVSRSASTPRATPSPPPPSQNEITPQNVPRAVATHHAEVSGYFHIPIIVFFVFHLISLTLLGFPEVLRIPYLDNVAQQFSYFLGMHSSDLMLGRIMPSSRMMPFFVLAIAWALVPKFSRRLPWLVLIIPAILLFLLLLRGIYQIIQASFTDYIGSLTVAIVLILLLLSDVLKLRTYRVKFVAFYSSFKTWLFLSIFLPPLSIGLGRVLRGSQIPVKIRRGDDLTAVLNIENLLFHWAVGATWAVVIWAALSMLVPPYGLKLFLKYILFMSGGLIFYYSVLTDLVSQIKF